MKFKDLLPEAPIACVCLGACIAIVADIGIWYIVALGIFGAAGYYCVARLIKKFKTKSA